jgi:polysaccharide export outer membrane protein
MEGRPLNALISSVTTWRVTTWRFAAHAALAVSVLLALGSAPGAVASPAGVPISPVIPSEALNDYEIGPGDLLKIEIFELEELSKEVRVTGEGTISYPMLGSVPVSGMRKRELENNLARLLEDRYVRNPQVTVFIKEMQSGKVSVLGAVNTPGGFGLVGSKTVLDALSQAGGITKEAGTRAFLIRGTGSEPFLVDLKKLMEEADLSKNVPVAPGDVIYVPKAKNNKVYVYGQVEKPGMFEVEEGDRVTVLQAVSMAGGLARRASPGKAKIVRAAAGGKRQVIRVHLDRIIAGKDSDAVLESGDIVVVPKSFF